MPFFPPSMIPPTQSYTDLASRPKTSSVPQSSDEPSPFSNSNDSGLQVSHHTRIRNRRKRYLDSHPAYLDSNPNLELANPLLYDRLVRSFQSAAEREAIGRRRGFAGILEADLCRAEARVAAVRGEEEDIPGSRRQRESQDASVEDLMEAPQSQQEGAQRWRTAMERRFVAGNDDDFDYTQVDDDEDYDDWHEDDRNRLDDYLDDEEPKFVLEDGRAPEGETGVQDY